MSHKTIFTLLLLVITFFSVISPIQQSLSYTDKWVPYTPSSDMVNVSVVMHDKLVKVNVSIIFPHGGFRVEWGQLKKESLTFYSDSKVDMWTGPSIQVITEKSYIYSLGELPPGKYEFVFLVNGEVVKAISFEVLSWKPDLEIFSWRILALLVYLLMVVFPIFSVKRRKTNFHLI
ncbi:MAG: hypothetical protein N3E48_03960 [Candidatus Bathyarchaeota archaeon]|nr:hypothetical protein [Candidatus Bathyarchaeota archaeon]